MKDIGPGRGIIPMEHAENLVPYLAEDEDDSDWLASPAHNRLGASPDLPFVQRNVLQVADNISLARSEAA